MKKFRSIVSLVLAAIVLVASVGVTINQHICMGKVRSVGVFSKAENCGMGDMGMKGHGCCDEKTILVKTRAANGMTTASVFHTPSLHLAAIFLPLIRMIIFPEPAPHPFAWVSYKPPLIYPDRTVFLHSFLI